MGESRALITPRMGDVVVIDLGDCLFVKGMTS